MKALLLAVIFILACLPGFSQKQFEGTIIYNLHSTDDESKEDAELIILFGKNAIKLKFKEKDRYDRKETLIRLDSGKVYTLNAETKTFRSKRLKEQEKLPDLPSGKKISGYSTNAMKATGNTTLGSMAAMFRMENVVFYISDSLYYTVPEKYASNAEVAFLYQGKIILGAEMTSPNYSLDDDNEDDKDRKDAGMNIIVEAKSVKWEIFKDDDFLIPPGYVKQQYDRLSPDSSYIMDSMLVMADSVAEKPIETKPVKKPPTNKKPPAKSKPGTSKQGAAQKPE